MATYYELLLLEEPPEEEPVQAKRALARRLVDRFHGEGSGLEAEAAFDRVHKRHEAPADVPELDLAAIEGLDLAGDGEAEVHLPLLLGAAFGLSTSEARRLLAQGAVKLDGETVPPDSLDVPFGELAGRVLQAGKRRFAAIPAKPG